MLQEQVGDQDSEHQSVPLALVRKRADAGFAQNLHPIEFQKHRTTGKGNAAQASGAIHFSHTGRGAIAKHSAPSRCWRLPSMEVMKLIFPLHRDQNAALHFAIQQIFKAGASSSRVTTRLTIASRFSGFQPAPVAARGSESVHGCVVRADPKQTDPRKMNGMTEA